MSNQNEVVYQRIKAHSFVYVKKQSQVRVLGQGEVFIYRLWDDFFLSEQSVSHDFARGEQVTSVREDRAFDEFKHGGQVDCDSELFE